MKPLDNMQTYTQTERKIRIEPSLSRWDNDFTTWLCRPMCDLPWTTNSEKINKIGAFDEAGDPSFAVEFSVALQMSASP